MNRSRTFFGVACLAQVVFGAAVFFPFIGERPSMANCGDDIVWADGFFLC